MKPTGGPAYPQHGWTKDPETLARMNEKTGMTLRDKFADSALKGQIAYEGMEGCDTKLIAGMAYELADAMLEARKS